MAGQPDQVTTFSYDPEDHILEKLVTAGDLSTREQWTYDLAGRMTSHTNAAGYLTTYTYANGGRTITRTNPDTSVVVTQNTSMAKSNPSLAMASSMPITAIRLPQTAISPPAPILATATLLVSPRALRMC